MTILEKIHLLYVRYYSIVSSLGLTTSFSDEKIPI